MSKYYCQHCKTNVETSDKFIEWTEEGKLMIDCQAFCNQCNRANFESGSIRKQDIENKIKNRKAIHKWNEKLQEAKAALEVAELRGKLDEQGKARARIQECERKMASLEA